MGTIRQTQTTRKFPDGGYPLSTVFSSLYKKRFKALSGEKSRFNGLKGHSFDLCKAIALGKASVSVNGGDYLSVIKFLGF